MAKEITLLNAYTIIAVLAEKKSKYMAEQSLKKY